MPARPPAPHRPEPDKHHDAIVIPQQRSPLPGLYLAGHWTTPSAGPPWVLLSGYNTAGMVLADAGGHPKWTH